MDNAIDRPDDRTDEQRPRPCARQQCEDRHRAEHLQRPAEARLRGFEVRLLPHGLKILERQCRTPVIGEQ
jgi:hypothetical protein